MKKIITAIVFCFLFTECFSQAGMWTWMKGDSIYNQPGNFGTQGVPSPSNNPPGFYEAAEWRDLQGNFWLFGGLNASAGGGPHFNGDLWKYDPLNNTWTWMKGTGIIDDPGNYGTMGVPALSNLPPARGWGASTWVDLTGDLWLYGGGSFKNDLWKYNIAANMWTWVHGSTVQNTAPVHGTQGIPSINNTPGGRTECSANWVDSNGDLWLFGGDMPGAADASDLWRYTILTNEWTWMKGPNVGGQPGVYGTMGTEDTSNVPGYRLVYCSWTDSNDKFWMFGGSEGGASFRNDMWFYDRLTNNWTWKSGTSQVNDNGSSGPLCSSSVNFVPSARYETRARWTTACGKFWLYGGAQFVAYCDLWYFDPLNLEWTLVQATSPTQWPVYGSLGIPNASNTPGRRRGTNAWLSNTGELYLFGGYVSATAGTVCGSDLWKYTIDTACTGSCVTTGFEENNPPEADELFVFPNPANSSFTLSFTSSERQTVELRIYNTLGEQIYFSKEEIAKGKFEKEINVEKLCNGIYFLQLKMKNGMMSRKVVVER